MMPILLIPLILMGLCAASFWVWILVDCLNNLTLRGSQRCCWALILPYTCLVGARAYAVARRSSQTTPIAPVSQSHREFVPSEVLRPYQEGYPLQRFHQDEQTAPEQIVGEDQSMPSQVRFEEMQVAYPEDPRARSSGSPRISI